MEKEKHICCDGECNHDSCCGKIDNPNCPKVDTFNVEEESWLKGLLNIKENTKHISRDELFFALENFVKKTLSHLREKDREGILKMITDEIAIAHTKDAGGKTSRLTSLYMRISKIKQ